MSEGKYREPWARTEVLGGYRQVVGSGDEYLFRVSTRGSASEDAAIAARIVAAVNLLAPLPDDAPALNGVRTDAIGLALSVLAGNAEDAYALADLIIMRATGAVGAVIAERERCAGVAEMVGRQGVAQNGITTFEPSRDTADRIIALIREVSPS